MDAVCLFLLFNTVRMLFVCLPAINIGEYSIDEGFVFTFWLQLVATVAESIKVLGRLKDIRKRPP